MRQLNTQYLYNVCQWLHNIHHSRNEPGRQPPRNDVYMYYVKRDTCFLACKSRVMRNQVCALGTVGLVRHSIELIAGPSITGDDRRRAVP